MSTEKSQAEVFQDDIHALLEVLELGNHARTESPHQVLHQEVIPAIKSLKNHEKGNSPSSPVAGGYAAAQELKEIVQAAHRRRHDPNPEVNVKRLAELPMTEEEYDRFRELLEAA